MRTWGLVIAFGLATAASAQPAFDPRTIKDAIAGSPSPVLVLGTPHLSEMSPAFRTEALGPLLDRLAAFRPDIITIEGLSGADCESLQRYRDIHGAAYDDYCRDTAEAEKATGMTVPAAMAAIQKTLAVWPKTPSAAERRRLASLFLAANDRASAQVQWLRLPLLERRAGDGLDEVLVTILKRSGGKPNENYDIAAVLAARLGLERVYPTDDHSADTLREPAFETAIQRVWSVTPPPPIRAEYEKQAAALATGAPLLDFYRFMNAPATQRGMIESDFHAAARQDTPRLYGRQYVAWWEVRNLRMVANIRAAFGPRPGSRVLVIVGASHKPYFDAYLDLMQDVRLVDAAALLK